MEGRKNKNLFFLFGILLSAILVFFVDLGTASAALDEGHGSRAEFELYTKRQLISTDGFLTRYNFGLRLCGSYSFGDVPKYERNDEGDLMAYIGNPIETVNQIAHGIYSKLLNFLVDSLEKVDSCAGESGETHIGFFSQISVFTQYVNITNLEGIMALTGIISKLALVLLILYILYEGFKLIQGSSTALDGSGMLKNLFRVGIVMYAISIAPWLIQDLLNLNNRLTNALAEQRISLLIDAETQNKVSFAISDSLLGAFAVFLKSVISPDFNAGENLIMAIFTLAIVIAVIIPIIKIIVWWYTRLFKIFIYTIISPIMIMTLASESTSSTGKNFAMNVFRTIFEQFFVLLGMSAIAVGLSEISQLMLDYGLGFIGIGLGLYAGLNFIAQIPDMVSGLIEGRVEGSVSTAGIGAGLAGVSRLARGGGRLTRTGAQAGLRRVVLSERFINSKFGQSQRGKHLTRYAQSREVNLKTKKGVRIKKTLFGEK